MELYITVSLCDNNLQLLGQKLNNLCRSGWATRIRAKRIGVTNPLRLQFCQQLGKTDAVVKPTCESTVVFSRHYNGDRDSSGRTFHCVECLHVCDVIFQLFGGGNSS